MVKNLSLRNQEKEIITAFPNYAHASRNVSNVKLDADHQAYREELVREGLAPAEAERDAKNSQFTSTLRKEKAKQISDSSLSDKAIIHGLQSNKDVQLLDDLATSNRRMVKILEGFVAKHGDNEAVALAELAKEIKQQNIKNSGALLEKGEFRSALAVQSDKLTRGILLAIADNAKSDDLDDLLQKIHTLNHNGFEKIYKDEQIKAIMRPELIDRHEEEGGEAPLPPGGVFIRRL